MSEFRKKQPESTLKCNLERLIHIDLNNFDSNIAEDCPYVLTSPRSLKACRCLNIRPVELLHKCMDDIAADLGLPVENVYHIYINYECQRQKMLELCRQMRNSMITENKPNDEIRYSTQKEKLHAENVSKSLICKEKNSSLSRPVAKRYPRLRKVVQCSLSSSSSLSSLIPYSCNLSTTRRSKSAEAKQFSKKGPQTLHKRLLHTKENGESCKQTIRKVGRQQIPTKQKIRQNFKTFKQKIRDNTQDINETSREMRNVGRRDRNIEPDETNLSKNCVKTFKDNRTSVEAKQKRITFKNEKKFTNDTNKIHKTKKAGCGSLDNSQDSTEPFIQNHIIRNHTDESESKIIIPNKQYPMMKKETCIRQNPSPLSRQHPSLFSKQNPTSFSRQNPSPFRHLSDHDLHILDSMTMKYDAQRRKDDLAFRAQLLWEAAKETECISNASAEKQILENDTKHQINENERIKLKTKHIATRSLLNDRYSNFVNGNTDYSAMVQNVDSRNEAMRNRMSNCINREKRAFERYIEHVHSRLKHLKENSLYRELHSQQVRQLAFELQAGMEQWQDQVLLLQWQSLQKAQTNAKLHLENKRLRALCENNERALIHAQRMKNIKNMQFLKLRGIKEQIEAKDHKIEALRLKREREILECRVQAQNTAELREQLRISEKCYSIT